MSRRLSTFVSSNAEPDTVAEAFVEALGHHDGRIHALVGDDAHMFVDQCMS